MSSAARKKHLKELARKKKQMREEGAGSAAAAPKGGSESNAKPLGRPPGRKDAAKRVRRTEAEQRDAAVAAGLGNALGGTRPHQKLQLVLDGRKSQAGEKRKQLPGQGQISFVAALFASFVCCFQMTIKSLRLSTQFIQKETGKGPAATAAGERRRQRSSISKDSICADTQSKCSSSSSSKYRAAMQQMQQNPRPIAQLTKAAQARAREGQQRQDLGTTAAPVQ